MFGKHRLHREEEISFAIDHHLTLFLERIKPPYASHLSLMQGNDKLIDVSVSCEHAKIIKTAIRKVDCTSESLITLLQKLQLTKFVAEVKNEMNTSTNRANDSMFKNNTLTQ